jgi:hypothetical protein
MQIMRLLFCIALPVLGTRAALADSGTLYVGAGVTHEHLNNYGAQFNPELPGNLADISATSWKALAGVRPLHWFAVEADYFATAGSVGGCCGNRSEARALGAYAVFLTGDERFQVFGKAGIEGYRLTARYGLGGGSDKATGAGAGLGAGFQWRFGRLGVRMEYEFLPGMGTSNGQVASLGVMFDLL